MQASAPAPFGFRRVRYSFDRDLDAYINGALRGGQMPMECEDLPAWTRDTEYLMLTLRTVRGLNPLCV